MIASIESILMRRNYKYLTKQNIIILSPIFQDNIPVIDITGDEPEVNLVFNSAPWSEKEEKKKWRCLLNSNLPDKVHVPKAGSKRTSPKANR